MMTMRTVEDVIEKIKENTKIEKVSVDLHIHKEQDEFAGMHTLHVSVWSMEYSELLKGERMTCRSLHIDLECERILKCKKLHSDAHLRVKAVYPKATRQIYTHNEPAGWED